MKKGFTLIELLAVIVILAVILAIAIPGISNIINASTKGAAESDAKMVIKALEYKMLEDNTFDPTTVNEYNVASFLNISDSNYQTLTVKKSNGSLYVTIVGKNKWNNITVSGTKMRARADDTQTSFVRGANAPVLTTGMTPIKWNGSTWVDTTSDDTAWYNYDTTNKIWANARTADGSMWVWIPRYVYKISSGWHDSTAGTIDIQFTKGVDDNWNKASIGLIDLGETSNASNNKWTNHPAFTFGDTELTGIWVAKFEASSTNPSDPNGGGDTTSLKVKSIPNVASWRSIRISNIFTVTRSMETDNTYGWGTSGSGIDTHLIKNTEWGAVAYLSKSVYGKNDAVWKNNNSNCITGCAANSAGEDPIAGCQNAYDTTNGFQASTSGNIYGIYDMSGGSYETVAAYVNNGGSELITNGSNLINAPAKYKNVYTVSSTDVDFDNYALTINSKGDAMYETSNTGYFGGWYSNYAAMAYNGAPWLFRGVNYSWGTHVGLFGFSRNWGEPGNPYSFRPVLLVEAGL